METLKTLRPFPGRAALMATACLIVPLSAGEIRGGPESSAAKTSQSGISVTEAQELLRKGDESYTAGRYADAAAAYAGARELIPDAAGTAELRAAATERYAQASVEYARQLVRKGDLAGAKAAVDKVLDPSVAPGNPGAVAYRAQLDDPIRINPALTKEHGADVDSVRRLLYTAQGAFDLGDYDKATTNYNGVLRIDPTNSAARRGLEEVSRAKSNYAGAAYDHARAEMLAQVDSQWELQVPEPEFNISALHPGGGGESTGDFVSVKNKLDRIIIPKLMLDQASLEEALDFLRVKAAENDTTETDPTRKGVNFTVNLGEPGSPAATSVRNLRFDLRLSQVPLSQVLKYLTEITHTAFSTDDYSVIIAPLGSSSPALVTRTYRVPPDFITSMGGASTPSTTKDPFAEGAGGGGVLTQRMGAQEALVQQGVAFGDGASATYMPATNTLRVVNTAANQEFIAQIVEAASNTEPVMVSVTVTMIKTEQTNLAELGFDWLLSDFETGGSAMYGSGGTVGNGQSFEQPVFPNRPNARNPVTAGNRSGDAAISGNALDGLLNEQGGRQTDAPAPGLVGFHGEINDATVNLLVRGLNQKKGVDLMAKPAVITRSGQSSSISIVREMIYPTEYEPPELPNSTGGNVTTAGGIGGGIVGNRGGSNVTPVTPATPSAFAKKDVGITMEILPVVDANKKTVNVTLNPTFSDFDGFVNYGSPINTISQGLLGPETLVLTENSILMPVFSVMRTNTNVDIADGATVVISGLQTQSVQNVEDKTPVLGNIPIVGRLFESNAKQTITSAVLFLVKVEVMDPTGRSFNDR